MENFCKVLSTNPPPRQKCDKFLSFQELSTITCTLTDEIGILEDIFRRQIWKVIEGEVKVTQAKAFVTTSTEELKELKKKQDVVDQQLSMCLFNMDLLELFLQSVEGRVPELSPKNADCIRYPVFQKVMSLVCMIDFNKENMEKFFEEYQEYVKAYSQKYILTSILDCHIKILQNISTHLDDLERSQKTTEQKINCQIQRNLMEHLVGCL